MISFRKVPIVFSLVIWAVVWEAVGRAELSTIIPSLTRIVTAGITVVQTEKFAAAALISLRSFAIGMAFALLPWANVLRNVAFGLELRGVPRAEREEIARMRIREVGLAGFEASYPSELSGGMRQRVGLARAFAVDADIVLMDEPFSSVDEQTRRKFQEDLLELLARQRKTVIFVTHSIEEAVYVSDQIVLLSPRPGSVSRIFRPGIDHTRGADEIRRDRRYLDAVDEIWQILRQYIA